MCPMQIQRKREAENIRLYEMNELEEPRKELGVFLRIIHFQNNSDF